MKIEEINERIERINEQIEYEKEFIRSIKRTIPKQKEDKKQGLLKEIIESEKKNRNIRNE